MCGVCAYTCTCALEVMDCVWLTHRCCAVRVIVVVVAMTPSRGGGVKWSTGEEESEGWNRGCLHEFDWKVGKSVRV